MAFYFHFYKFSLIDSLFLGKFLHLILEIKEQIYVISGGPGFGKTVLIDYLSVLGYTVGKEAAREIIAEQQKTGGNILPQLDMRSFRQEVFKRRWEFYQSVPSGTIAFCDRAIPDQLAFALYLGIPFSPEIEKIVEQHRYNTQVFITPPWPEIYENDDIRKESYNEAVAIHQAIIEVYRRYNYQLIEIPKLDVKQRAEFLSNLISEKK